ncbi:MAG: hypothetical protein ACJATN_000319 [Neolewinella sp.]|jgi:hypothetical protein|nr:hypothetical protein [Lewinella sp.]
MSTPTFNYFLEQFPDLELPLTFSEDTVRTISRETPPLPPALIAEFLIPIEPGMADELTEFIACLRLPENKAYAGIVYWRADLLQYHYTLATFNPETNELIDRQVIAGVSYDGEEVTQTQAILNDNMMIYQVSGQANAEGEYDYKASSSTARRFQIAPSGKIIEL